MAKISSTGQQAQASGSMSLPGACIDPLSGCLLAGWLLEGHAAGRSSRKGQNRGK